MSATTTNGRRAELADRHPDVAAELTHFGAQVRRLRIERNRSQETLAKLVGCDRQSINRIENAAYTPGLHRLFQLARALGVHPAVLVGGIPAPAPPLPGQEGLPAVSEYDGQAQ